MEQREFVVEQETAGQRIDRFLSGEDTGLSRSALQALVADGHVLCNGRLVAKSLKLKAGDTIVLEIPDAKPIEAVPQDIPLEIVYEDEHLLVVNKPKGMVVHPAPGNPDGKGRCNAHRPFPADGGAQCGARVSHHRVRRLCTR